jgi:N-acylneuraminate cytidylyltransferase
VNLAVIPARGGSKRIPGKNIRRFAGRPMIAWAIATARDSGLFDRIIVSTDSDEVAAVAREAGAEVPFRRPAELSDDHCGTLEVMTHAVGRAQSGGLDPRLVCCLYPTAVLTGADDLRAALTMLDGGDWDYVFAAGRFAQPVQRAFVRGEDDAMVLLFPEHRLTRTQDLPPAYHDAGQFYWGRAEAWGAGRPIYGPRTTFIELPPERCQDIDTPQDWDAAERLFAQVADGSTRPGDADLDRS